MTVREGEFKVYSALRDTSEAVCCADRGGQKEFGRQAEKIRSEKFLLAFESLLLCTLFI